MLRYATSEPPLAVRVPASMPGPFRGLAACGSKAPRHPLPSPSEGEGVNAERPQRAESRSSSRLRTLGIADMARLPRLAVAGHLHLLIQRGHNGQVVFTDNDDRAREALRRVEGGP